MAHLSHSTQVKAVLKKLLKKRGISYADLAEELNCSIPTVKRIMSTEEITLSRLMAICRFLNVSFAELERLAEKWGDTERVSFTEEQDEFFAENPQYLSYLQQIYNDYSPAQIAEMFGLSRTKNLQYLHKLEDLDLIHISSRGQIRLKHKDFPALRTRGKLWPKQYRNIWQRYSDFFTKKNLEWNATGKKNKLPSTMHGSNGKIHPDTYNEFQKRLGNLLSEFMERSEVDELSYNSSELYEAVVFFNILATDTDDADLDVLKYMYGKP